VLPVRSSDDRPDQKFWTAVGTYHDGGGEAVLQAVPRAGRAGLPLRLLPPETAWWAAGGLGIGACASASLYRGGRQWLCSGAGVAYIEKPGRRSDRARDARRRREGQAGAAAG